MNVGIIFSRILAVVMVVFVGNAKADNIVRLFQNGDKIAVSLGSLLIDEKRTKIILGDRLSPRTRIIIGKVVAGWAGHCMHHDKNIHHILEQSSTGKETYVAADGRIMPCYTSFNHAAGYVALNGTLRLVGNKLYLDDEFVEKKCDEVLPESIAWIVKPVANIAMDLAYDYVTVKLLEGIVDGVNRSR